MENDSEFIVRSEQGEGFAAAVVTGFVAGVATVLTLLKLLGDN